MPAKWPSSPSRRRWPYWAAERLRHGRGRMGARPAESMYGAAHYQPARCRGSGRLHGPSARQPARSGVQARGHRAARASLWKFGARRGLWTGSGDSRFCRSRRSLGKGRRHRHPRPDDRRSAPTRGRVEQFGRVQRAGRDEPGLRERELPPLLRGPCPPTPRRGSGQPPRARAEETLRTVPGSSLPSVETAGARDQRPFSIFFNNWSTAASICSPRTSLERITPSPSMTKMVGQPPTPQALEMGP